jgi:hypothetical protein
MDASEEATGPADGERQAYCATHADRPAAATCARCGDHVCEECTARHTDAGALCKRCSARSPTVSARGLTKLLSALFFARVAIEAIMIAAILIEMSLFASPTLDEAAFATYLSIVGVIGLADIGLLLATIVCFCMWMNRSNRIARELGGNLQHGPHGWGWFFVPCANLFMPYRAVKELYSSIKDGYAPGIFPAWWGAWIVSNIIANFETRMSLSESPGMVEGSMVISIFGAASTIAAALLARQVVVAVNEAQEPTSAAAEPPAP